MKFVDGDKSDLYAYLVKNNGKFNRSDMDPTLMRMLKIVLKQQFRGEGESKVVNEIICMMINKSDVAKQGKIRLSHERPLYAQHGSKTPDTCILKHVSKVQGENVEIPIAFAELKRQDVLDEISENATKLSNEAINGQGTIAIKRAVETSKRHKVPVVVHCYNDYVLVDHNVVYSKISLKSINLNVIDFFYLVSKYYSDNVKNPNGEPIDKPIDIEKANAGKGYGFIYLFFWRGTRILTHFAGFLVLLFCRVIVLSFCCLKRAVPTQYQV